MSDYVGPNPIMIKVDFVSGGGNNAFLDDFQLTTVLDTEEFTAEDITLYPNPSNGSFNVEGLPVGTDYSIISLDGRLIQQGQLNTERTIDINTAAGYYIFQAGTVRKPIVIQ